MDFVLLNLSTTTDEAYGGELTPSTLAQIAEAVELQLNLDFSQCGYGGSYRVRAGANADDCMPGEIPIRFIDTMPAEDAGAAAFHTTDAQGRASGAVARDDYNSLTRGGNALSVGVSHECLETARDVGCVEFALRADGKLKAVEVCDQVEDTTYDKTLQDGTRVAVSNFMLPSAWSIGASGPYDRLELLVSADGRTPGGYCIVMTVGDPTQETGGTAMHATVEGTPRPERAKAIARASSRVARRVAKVQAAA